MTDQDLILAPSLIPCSKSDWDGLNQHSNRDEIKERLLKQMEVIDDGTHPCVRNVPVSNFPENGELSRTIDLTPSESGDPDEESVEEKLVRFLSSTE